MGKTEMTYRSPCSSVLSATVPGPVSTAQLSHSAPGERVPGGRKQGKLKREQQIKIGLVGKWKRSRKGREATGAFRDRKEEIVGRGT